MKDPKIMLAGGGDPPQQQQMIQMPITPPEPPKDNALLWATGVFVPVVVALIGLWAIKHKKS